MKAKTLPEVIRAFDPHRPLRDDELKTWYIDRPGNPAEEIKIYLQGVGLHNEPVRLLFTGHTGSGKSTELNRLATAIKSQFFIVPFDVGQSLSIADLSYVDLLVGMATALFRRATEPDVLGKAAAQIATDVWDDLARFIETVIFGPASFRQPPAGVELATKVNLLAVEFQTKFSSEATTRDETRRRLEPRLAELTDKIDHVAGLVHTKYRRPVLFLVEGTDKPDRARARDIFLGHTYTLTAFRASVIYTFPIDLRYSGEFNLIKDSFTWHYMLPNLKVVNRDDSDNVEGLAYLSRAISHRMEDALISEAARDTIIRASGGLMRTLVGLVRSAAVKAVAAGKDTIDRAEAEAAVNAERADYVTGLKQDDYEVLRQRHADKRLSADEAVLSLLHTRALLEYANDEPWCDVHPIALPLIQQRGSPKQA